MMKVIEVAKLLNLPVDWTENGSSAEASILNSDEYGKLYNKLDSNSDLEPVEDLDELSLFTSSFTWKYFDNDNEMFVINLNADFENDEYTIKVTEGKDETTN